MATFPSYQPNYSATKTSAPKTRVVEFGDGYQQRLAFGLHQNPKEWALSFNLSEADANVVESFLDARALDSASFDWTPPNEVTSYKWICRGWTREMFDVDRSRIDATFVQVFEP